MKFGAKIMRLRAKLRQRREEKRNKITNKNAIYAPRHKWHGLEGKCEPERNAVQAGGTSIPLA
jgi:hypothetical protein